MICKKHSIYFYIYLQAFIYFYAYDSLFLNYRMDKEIYLTKEL